MLAVGLHDYGGPEVLRLVELPDPHPAPGQVRVKVCAAGINPVDVMVRDGSLAGWFAGARPPFVPGMDIAGTIDEVGEGVDPQLGVAIGQDVAGVVDNFGCYGGYSQYVCLPAASVIPVPAGTTFPAAASFLMNALTARKCAGYLAPAGGLDSAGDGRCWCGRRLCRRAGQRRRGAHGGDCLAAGCGVPARVRCRRGHRTR
ncbi:alcohol dehydrogenase catalytic domain-containing protein [Xanthomonas campestris pv. heliotropii]|nr:alcohol dehydrogenase catalytic domain-containing protein [Xanthomonas campestris pv. heliotropii]